MARGPRVEPRRVPSLVTNADPTLTNPSSAAVFLDGRSCMAPMMHGRSVPRAKAPQGPMEWSTMSVSVTLPQAAEWPDDGAVAEWYVPDGAAVRVGDPVCRFESGFVSLELEAEGDGILSYRHGIAGGYPAGGYPAGGFPPDGVLAVIVADGEPLPDLGTPARP